MRRTILAAVAIALMAGGARAADIFTPGIDGWTTYINERFGVRLDFPDAIFIPLDAPENGDGRTFASRDARLQVFAFQNVDNDSAASLKERLVGAEGYTDVTYSPSGDNWLVLSGYRGGKIFYEKYFFEGDFVAAFGIEFPTSAKPVYAPIIERIEDSFRVGPE